MSTNPTPNFTQTVPQEDNLPPRQPVTDIAEEVNIPTEVDENISHHSIDQVQSYFSTSSISNEGKKQYMSMNETYPREASEQA